MPIVNRIKTSISKVNTDTGVIVLKDFISTENDLEVNEGVQDYMIVIPSSGSKTIDITEVTNINLIRIEGFYAEDNEASGIIGYETNAAFVAELKAAATSGAKIRTNKITIEGKSTRVNTSDNVENIVFENPDISNDIVVKFTIGGEG